MNNLSATASKARTLYNTHLWQGRLILAAMITLLVLAVVRVSLPYTIVYSSAYWLGKHGIASQIEDISINVTRGTFTIINARGTKNGDSVFNVGKASIDWEWRPLAARTIHVKGIELDDVNLIAEQHSDALVIAGIVIRDDGTVEQQADGVEDDVAWGTSLNQIDFNDLGFCFKHKDTAYDENKPGNSIIDYCGNVDLLAWQGDFSLGSPESSTQANDQILVVNGSVKIERLKLFNNKLNGTLINVGEISLSDIKVDGFNDIKLNAVVIGELALLQQAGHPRHEHAVEFNKLALSDISISNADSIVINSIILEKPVISMAMEDSGAYRYEPWLLPQKPEPADASEMPTNQAAGTRTYNIKLSSITVTDTELCYQQPASGANNTQALDYCMNLAGTEWTGDIAINTPGDTAPLALSINGGLALSRLLTTNNLLKRDLFGFEQLAINDIAIISLDDAAFGALKLDQATGLEITSTEDKHTITVADVDLNAFSYRNNTVAVGKLAINDLGIDITQNEDGSLDFEKWNLTTTDNDKAEAPVTSEANAEPIKIKVDEFSLDTTRLVQFADLSVTPNMLVGLKEIHFSVKNLDSDKPAQKSPIKLSAKTTRHGTIDLEGVIMPFESKPSFDATGKITGIDLRVASPKAEQAVGHIIKSGQMDADLKLLSVAGKLDSEISLVLHHFKLKAKSKEDAAALDKTFGMPINQSLVLLKDKKGRIKLDIPITGDINSPEFDPTDAIVKATAKATTVTLITFYTPYGLAFAGGNILFDLATAMNFDPLVFEPGSTVLTETHEKQLSKLSELLTERPAVHLTLCGFTNLNDRSKITTEVIDKNKIKPPSTERLIKLKQLGSERQQNVKNHLVTAGKISHDRLILCEPEHSDDAEAIAGVEISI